MARVLPLLALLMGFVQESAIDVAVARRCFQEAKSLSDEDAGKLWGRTLYGPMMFVDPRTRVLVANENPKAEGFEERDGVFTGRLPAKIGLANYAFDWEGTRWSMVIWPLPPDRADRATLLMHELFHRIQPELGFPVESPANAHLETRDARVWLQVELAALARALEAESPADRDDSAAAALLFREERHKLDPKAKSEEDRMELNEGLAQYTGLRLGGGSGPEARQRLIRQLRQAIGLASYTRRFAYFTGAAYGFLLDRVDEEWRKSLTGKDALSTLLAKAVQARDGADVEKRGEAYGLSKIRAQEVSRESERRKREELNRRIFLTSPVLVLPLAKMRNSFRTEDVFAMGADGTHFAAATLSDEWGTLEVTAPGFLLSADRKTARVPAPKSADSLQADGWKLTLNPGWAIVPGDREGHFVLQRR